MESKTKNIFSDQFSEEDYLKVDLDQFIAFLKDESNALSGININKLETLIDKNFIEFISNNKEGGNTDFSLKLLKLEECVLLTEKKVKLKDKGKLHDYKNKINIYKQFYEKRSSNNLAKNISELTDFNLEKGLLLLGKQKEKNIKEEDENCYFTKTKKSKFINKIIIYLLLFIIIILAHFSFEEKVNIGLLNYLIIFLSILVFHFILLNKELKYDRFKEILVNTYRFSSISQWLFYINENSNSEKDKIEKQKELVEYYDKHLEKEQNRQVKYGYAKKLFVLLVIESILLFAIFGYLINKFSIDELNKVSDLLKWTFGLTLGQIVGMVLIIVKYLFKDNQKEEINKVDKV